MKMFKKIMQTTKSGKNLPQNPLVPSPMVTFVYEIVHQIVDYDEEKADSSTAGTKLGDHSKII